MKIKSLKHLTSLFAVLLLMGTGNVISAVNSIQVAGELKQWHKVTLEIEGPTCSETGTPNPFLDYKLTGTFTQGDLSYKVPGYFAADGDAANTGANEGNIWRVHFTPPTTGEWSYTVRFRSGTGSAIENDIATGTAVEGLDNQTGSFNVEATDKTGKDLRSKGRLEYVGEHHLRFAGTGQWFLKAGPDSPENFLAYEDFDNTPNSGSRRKSWSPHQKDWNEGDPSWKDGKGTEIIGAINYLASRGLNTFSFLTMNINGEDKNVYPYVTNNNFKQFDCSKLDQWEIVFEHGQNMGMHLHFKTQETENETLLDNGDVGVTRKMYYRELIARFGHHLALNWNLGEENQASFNEGKRDLQNEAQRKAMAEYFHDNDPYKNNIVIHTAPGDHDKIYKPLLGDNSKLTGASIQTDYTNVHNATNTWVTRSAEAGKKWVVANDEQGNAKIGVADDAAGTYDGIRQNVLWGNYMAGGAGVEYYFGYETVGTDLDCEDFRSRELSWRFCGHALLFFNRYVPYWEMKADDSKTSTGWCLYKENEVYVVYLKSGGSPKVDLGTGTYNVSWFNPKTGGELIAGESNIEGGSNTSIGSSPNSSQDWAALIRNTTYTHNCNSHCNDDLAVIEVSISPTSVLLEKIGDIQQLSADIYPSNAADKSVTWKSEDTSIATVDKNGLVTAVADGKTKITVTTTDGNKTASVGVNVGDASVGVAYGENWIVFEAESTVSDLDKWVLRTPDDPKYIEGTRDLGPINETYIEFTGNDKNGGSPTSPLIYKFTAPKTAEYSLTMRMIQNLEGAEWDKCNDVYIKMDGNFSAASGGASKDILTSFTKLYGRGKDNWGSMVQFDVNHTKYKAKYNLIEGEEYVLTMAGRAQRTGIDYIILFESALNLKFGEEIDVASVNDEKYLPQTMECNLINAQDFDTWTGIDGFTDAAVDNKAGMKILQIGTRDAWAAAQYTYHGSTMSAYFNIHAMQEGDGESTYKVRVNNELIGEATNDRIYGTAIPDYTIQVHEMNRSNPIRLQDGDLIQVEFNNATNGLVPEGNLTATSRGRWYGLEICTDNIVREPVNSVAIEPETLELSKNNSYTLTANIQPEIAYNKNVTWESDNTDVVTIDKDGVLTGIADGNATITVTTIDGEFTATCAVTVVTKAITAIGVTPNEIEIIEGQTAQLSPIYTPVDASNKNITWESDNTDVVTVKSNGQIQAQATGTANVTVKSEDGGFTATCVVTVPNIKVFNLTPIHDAFIEGSKGFNTNDLKIESGRRTTYMMFDLSEVPENINVAELTLSVGADAGNGTIKIELADNSDWTESNLSPSNAPSASSELGKLNQTFANNNSYTWELNTEKLNGGDKVSFILTHSGGSDVWFSSKEIGTSGKRPNLMLICPNSGNDDDDDDDDTSGFNSLENNNEKMWSVYPNPLKSGEFTVKINNTIKQATQLKILDLQGRSLISQAITSNQTTFSSNIFPSKGMFLIQLVSADQLTTQKLVVQ